MLPECPCEGQKRLLHPLLGELALDFFCFAVDGRDELMMLLYTPLSAADAARIRAVAAGVPA